jgi:hypothetical protein
MPISPHEVQSDFQVFLKRPADPAVEVAFKNVPELIHTLFRSPEFRKSPQAKKYGYDWPRAQFLVSIKHRILFCPIGKNACTFLKRQMVRIEQPNEEEFLVRDIHLLTDQVNTGFIIDDYPPDQAKDILNASDYFRFAVLRDPMDRLLSAYTEKFVIDRNNPGNIMHTGPVVSEVQKRQDPASEADFNRGITFREVLSFRASSSAEKLDPHWIPQANYLDGFSWKLYGFDMIDLLVDELEARTGVTLPRLPDNFMGSGQGAPVEGALDMLPAELLFYGRIAKQSFWTDETKAEIQAYYARDYAYLKQVIRC